MASKDYYQILGVSPAASSQEIKKSFRALAHRFHPDKNDADAMAAIHFREIQEAYAVLSDKAKRTAWHYEHYYTLNKAVRTGTVTPEWILIQCRQLVKYISRENPFLLNQDFLFVQIRELLSAYHLSILQHHGDIETNSLVVQQLLTCFGVLSFPQATAIAGLLREVQPVQANIAGAVNKAWKERKQQWLMERYKVPAAILLALVLLVIMAISQR